MKYTVRQLANLAGVTVRTLHYYDQIGLLTPSAYGENRYRYYGEEAVLRLQQILFFRELDFSLEDIQAILDQPEFDTVQALQTHKQALQHKVQRLTSLIHTIDKTMSHLKGKYEMNTNELFQGFDEEKQKRYEQEAIKQYGETNVRQSIKRWNSYSEQQQAQIKQEGGAIYTDLVAAMSTGPASQEVQALLGRWHQHLRHFYEPTPEVLRGLGNGYYEHPEFNSFFAALHPDLPAFLQQAITHYVEVLETEALTRELALLEA
jgi:DNA-binding transcriptional MerR regulator